MRPSDLFKLVGTHLARTRFNELDDFVPVDSHEPYDMAELVRLLVDDGKLCVVHERHARNIVTAISGGSRPTRGRAGR